MKQDQATQDSRYQTFIEQVTENGQVWGLLSDDGWATSYSNEYEDTDVIVFWSDKAACASSAVEEWADYKPDTIPLGEFLESWCVGMHNNSTLAGTNWDATLQGAEVEPVKLALDLCTQVLKRKKKVELVQFDSLEEFKQQVEEAAAREAEEEE